MSKREEKRTQATVSRKVYTNTELDQLWKEIEQFRETKIVANFKTGAEEEIHPINWHRFYSSKGVVQVYIINQRAWDPKKCEPAGLTGEKIMTSAIIYDDLNIGGVIPYLEVEDMVRQCMDRRGRIEYGEKMRMADLERQALAESMHLEPVVE